MMADTGSRNVRLPVIRCRCTAGLMIRSLRSPRLLKPRAVGRRTSRRDKRHRARQLCANNRLLHLRFLPPLM